MQLNTVVLPAPLGPISAVISPRLASKDRSPMATSPPNFIDRCSTLRIGVGHGWSRVHQPCPSLVKEPETALRSMQEGGRFTAADEAARLPQHDDDHRQAEQQHAVEFRREVLRRRLP